MQALRSSLEFRGRCFRCDVHNRFAPRMGPSKILSIIVGGNGLTSGMSGVLLRRWQKAVGRRFLSSDDEHRPFPLAARRQNPSYSCMIYLQGSDVGTCGLRLGVKRKSVAGWPRS